MKNVRKVYKMGEERIVALNQVTLDFEKGKVYCLVGTSGSGKSTLLNLIAGLEKPTRGEIIFKSAHIERMNEKQLADYRQKYIGFVFQSYNLLPSLTALENVTMPLIFKKVRKKKRIARARSMLKSVGLEDRAKHKPSQLSGGQQQRVSIARAFISQPAIVFADEPTGNLDTKTTFEMMDLITEMAKENEQTLIIVTHDLDIARYANTIIHIRDGNIEWIEDNPDPIDSANRPHSPEPAAAHASHPHLPEPAAAHTSHPHLPEPAAAHASHPHSPEPAAKPTLESATEPTLESATANTSQQTFQPN